jgi:hypothetical protein
MTNSDAAERLKALGWTYRKRRWWRWPDKGPLTTAQAFEVIRREQEQQP